MSLRIVSCALVVLLCTAVGHAQQAIIHTNYGTITLQLYPQDAPKTVANFVNLSTSGFYNGTYFYRLAAGFVLQGGGYYNNQTSNITVPLEYKLPNAEWTVGLARAAAPNTGSSEYFINLGNNTQALAPGGSSADGYCVFAMVIGGFDTVRALIALPTHFVQQDGMNEFYKPWPSVEYIQIVA
jgi:cyclophilin family peptidyl-prolyl cis-trans isomerase